MRTIPLALSCIAVLFAGAAARGETPVRIENDLYTVSWDPAQASFTASLKATGKPFLSGGKLSQPGGTATVVDVTDKTFGAGKAIEVTAADGNRDRVAVYPGLPFVLISATLHNGKTEPVVVDRFRACSAGIALGKPVAELRTLGTGGLLTPEKNPGSYAFLAVVDPESRAGVVGGWITHDRGSGVVFSPVEEGALRLQAQIDYGCLRIKPGQDAATETFAVGHFADARLGLEAYADAIAKVYTIKLLPQQSGFCTWYTEKYNGACDEKHLAELAAFAAKELKPFGFDFVQIDDHWQAGISKNGPKRNFTTHAPNGPYPSGMKATADKIRSLGLVPGIWFIPFAGTAIDPYFEKHQDWFAQQDGKPFEARWGGTCLDMSQPGAREHVRDEVRRIAHDWGYTLFKMDGMWTGTATRLMYVNNGYKDDQIGEAKFHDPDTTHISAFRSGLKLVRETAGPKVFLLGCCVSQNMRSFGGAMGLVDAMRVGPDTGAGHIGAPHGSRTWFLNGRVWYNDPDCVSVRTSTPLERARLNASWTTIAGQLFYNSDWMPDLPPERLEILKRCLPSHGLPSRPVDVFESEPAQVWLLTDTRHAMRRDVVALYNWGSAAKTIECTARQLGLPEAKQYVAFDFWANKFVRPLGETIRSELPGGSCRILAIRPVADVPQLLSTSRHVTQGMVDVADERWDAATSTLSGTSRLVGGDPYELRIIVPLGGKLWLAKEAAVGDEDTAAGVKATMAVDGPKVRTTITSPTSREVHWRVRFEPSTAVALPTARPIANLKATAEYQEVVLRWDDNGADAYRVTRDDGKTFECSQAMFCDTTAEHGHKYRYTVAALDWGGVPGAAATVEATTPAELKRPPIPPKPTVHLSDLKPLALKVGHGKPGINKSATGKSLVIAKKTYEKGLGLHAKALAVYKIPAGARRFVAVVGLDDKVLRDPRASIVCEVYGDVKEMGEQPVLLAKTPVLCDKTVRSWAFDVELNSRYKELQLVVGDAGDGINSDHADWVDAGFITAK